MGARIDSAKVQLKQPVDHQKSRYSRPGTRDRRPTETQRSSGTSRLHAHSAPGSPGSQTDLAAPRPRSGPVSSAKAAIVHQQVSKSVESDWLNPGTITPQARLLDAMQQGTGVLEQWRRSVSPPREAMLGVDLTEDEDMDIDDTIPAVAVSVFRHRQLGVHQHAPSDAAAQTATRRHNRQPLLSSAKRVFPSARVAQSDDKKRSLSDLPRPAASCVPVTASVPNASVKPPHPAPDRSISYIAWTPTPRPCPFKMSTR